MFTNKIIKGLKTAIVRFANEYQCLPQNIQIVIGRRDGTLKFVVAKEYKSQREFSSTEIVTPDLKLLARMFNYDIESQVNNYVNDFITKVCIQENIPESELQLMIILNPEDSELIGCIYKGFKFTKPFSVKYIFETFEKK